MTRPPRRVSTSGSSARTCRAFSTMRRSTAQLSRAGACCRGSPGCKHVAFADPSGGRGDSFTLAVAHEEPAADAKQPGRVVLDCLQAVAPPFDPECVVSSMAETLKGYGLREVQGDQYAGEWCPAAFQRYGITYKPSELTRSEIYLECLPLFCARPHRAARPAGAAHAITATGAAHACRRSR